MNSELELKTVTPGQQRRQHSWLKSSSLPGGFKDTATSAMNGTPDARAQQEIPEVLNLLKDYCRGTGTVQGLMMQAVMEEEDPPVQYFPTQQAALLVDLSHLSVEEQEQVAGLMNPTLFTEKPGYTDMVQHSIHLKGNTLACQTYYRVTERLLPMLQEELVLMREMGVIEPSNSEWCSSIVQVSKKDGTMHFCIDFRMINTLSKFNPYPMLRVDDMIERPGKARYITTTDLSKGYWQVPLAQESKELSALRTPYGMFPFTVIVFGLQGAPATFQSLMDQVLEGTADYVVAYLDDMAIFSDT
ncbi:hypothetical protein P4O66_020238 [Electrophorus voltai]|uniref:ribonuclease H n=1 Tax=Electrophorus voltai TaxID=2609070 RepID=A0AAD9E3Y5_9TELE|nr:hypothetical protein P4O66_020238 [Electrophorus voltai]